ncbi:hypothetical protein [Aureimonas leprariae]|uniref:Tetratricopeptide repeat protein n=1 Tax=Plantimonas leprariae TaxID=2615207 RepID=A0A7V7PL47_9HYPH|nr:hypothetical protein [Aureimonas leprariae]KAB0676864.1 hypothetical protein F6X38_20040 [Aureimonas leprariae]
MPDAASTGTAASPGGSVLGSLFGLDADEAAVLADLVREGASAGGLDGARLAAALDEGRPLGAALGLPPALSEILYARAHRWFEAGRPERAEPLFRALCTLDGTVADYWIGLGICLRLAERLDLAELAFATAIRLQPDWPLPLFHLAELLARCGRLAEARDALARFERLSAAAGDATLKPEAERLAAVLAAHRAGSSSRG